MRSVFTDYYCFQKQGKTKHNLFCVASTHSYDSFEIRRCIEPSKETARNDAYNVGDLRISCATTCGNYSEHAQTKQWRMVRFKNAPLSGVYAFLGAYNNTEFYAFGDMDKTSDALLFVISGYDEVGNQIQGGAKIEIFVARGHKAEASQLCQMADDGEFDGELNQLRKEAMPDNPQQ